MYAHTHIKRRKCNPVYFRFSSVSKEIFQYCSLKKIDSLIVSIRIQNKSLYLNMFWTSRREWRSGTEYYLWLWYFHLSFILGHCFVPLQMYNMCKETNLLNIYYLWTFSITSLEYQKWTNFLKYLITHKNNEKCFFAYQLFSSSFWLQILLDTNVLHSETNFQTVLKPEKLTKRWIVNNHFYLQVEYWIRSLLLLQSFNYFVCKFSCYR